jgi:hypothetical protein
MPPVRSRHGYYSRDGNYHPSLTDFFTDNGQPSDRFTKDAYILFLESERDFYKSEYLSLKNPIKSNPRLIDDLLYHICKNEIKVRPLSRRIRDSFVSKTSLTAISQDEPFSDDCPAIKYIEPNEPFNFEEPSIYLSIPSGDLVDDTIPSSSDVIDLTTE